MIQVKVKAILNLASVMGCCEQVISLPEGSRLSDLLDTLEEKYGQPLNKIFYRGETRELNHVLSLLVNGRNIIFLDGFETRLKDSDELFFLPQIGGG